MASTNFVSGTTIASAWLNDVNSLVYTATQTGVGAVPRLGQSKLNDVFGTADYDTLAHAKIAAGNSPVIDPLGIVNKDVFNNLTNVFQQSGETTWKSANIYRSSDNTGVHGGTTFAALSLENRPIGSGTNGPSNADVGLILSNIKQNYLTTAIQGEMDGLYIVTRQGGGSNSDSAGILVDSAVVNNSGFCAVFESNTTQLTSLGATTRQMDNQIGIIDGVHSNYIGYYVEAKAGTLSDAYRASNSGSGLWTNFLNFIDAGTTKSLFKVDFHGQVILTDFNAVANPTKTIRSVNNNLSIVNSAGTTEILSLSDVGLLTVPGNMSAGGFQVVSTQVVGSRVTGWGVASNGSRAALNGSTATLAQTSAALAQLIIDLTTHGLIGA